MTAVGVPVMPNNNHRMPTNGERFSFRAKRAPPPPPTIVTEPRPISSGRTNRLISLHHFILFHLAEMHQLTTGISSESGGTSNKDYSTLL